MTASATATATATAAAPLQSNLDHVVAMELWWRVAALQALVACVQGPLAQAPRSQQAQLYKRAAALLKPTLDVFMAHAALQVGAALCCCC